ncbi:hypothetical protein PRIPAC_73674 [Pristionchus pacificus]|uniref:Uncharacterized protein n=1 Tax=Pristionchus pacificus TaxID=54126 RepID=A0A2A6C4Z4_PRIPA|nr:hypothetical protein PRIPAC_73674 [Pristionchus pacificus]|eukprot:PDM73292.1 hypothetical protein PRIPAC_40648 [Pristionchus pacificus]
MDDAAPSTSLVCNFCSATSSAEGGPLLGCANCQVAAYCCSDHQNNMYCRAVRVKNKHLNSAHSLTGHSDEIVCGMKRPILHPDSPNLLHCLMRIKVLNLCIRSMIV